MGVYNFDDGGGIMSCPMCEGKKTIRSAEDKKKLITRVNKIKGQMEGISKMIEEDRYCSDILIQLSAIEKSVRSLSTVIFDNHMRSCVVEGIKQGDDSKVDEIIDLFRRFQ